MEIIEALVENPIIAAVRDEEELDAALQKNPQIIFLLKSSILVVPKLCQKVKEYNKFVFVHVDMIDGLKGDIAGIEFIKQCGVDGIISTKAHSIKQANRLGLLTILRIFMIDSQSLKTGIPAIADSNPIAIEVMPGVANRIIEKISQLTNTPVIAGGLIQEKSEVIDALSSGAIAISTTAQKLWNL